MNKRVTRRTVLGGAALTLLGATAGCLGGDLTESERVEATYGTSATRELVIEGVGEVAVRAQERSDVAVTGTKRAASEGGLGDVQLGADRTDGTLTLAVERDRGPLTGLLDPDPTMDLSVQVPRDLRVERVATTNGPTTVTGVVGPVVVESTNRAITVSEIRGNADVRGANGSVVVSDVAGDLVAETTNGSIEAAAIDGDVALESTNGNITLTVAPDLDATVDLDTENGDVIVTGVGDLSGTEDYPVTLGDGSRSIELETANGDVTLQSTGSSS